MVQDARKFIYSSDNEIPSFVYKTEGLVTNPSGTYLGGCIKITHKLPFTPLIVGIWSLNQDFSNAHDISSGRLSQESGVGFTLRADSTYIYINASASTGTETIVYYRLYAYAPPDYADDVSPISDDSVFHFSTDYEYLKIAKSGKVDPNGNRQVEIDHGLGYLSLYKIWRTDTMDFSENNTPTTVKGLGLVESYVDYSDTYVMQNVADRNKLTISWWDYTPDGSDYAYYHIYSNEA